MDYAFGLFEPGEDGCVDEREVPHLEAPQFTIFQLNFFSSTNFWTCEPSSCSQLRRVLQNPYTGAALAEEELQEMFAELEVAGCGFKSNSGRIPLTALRKHPCFDAPEDVTIGGGPQTATRLVYE